MREQFEDDYDVQYNELLLHKFDKFSYNTIYKLLKRHLFINMNFKKLHLQ